MSIVDDYREGFVGLQEIEDVLNDQNAELAELRDIRKYKDYFDFLLETAWNLGTELYPEPSPAEFSFQWSWQQHELGEEWFTQFKEDVEKWKSSKEGDSHE